MGITWATVGFGRSESGLPPSPRDLQTKVETSPKKCRSASPKLWSVEMTPPSGRKTQREDSSHLDDTTRAVTRVHKPHFRQVISALGLDCEIRKLWAWKCSGT